MSSDFSSCNCCPPISSQSSATLAFGSLFGNPTAFTTAVNNTNLTFSTAGPTSGMVATPATGSITINTFGVYEITLSLSNQIVGIGSVQYSIFLNNTTNITTSNMFFQAAVALVTVQDTGAKTILITLNPNDVITVRPTSVIGVNSYGNPTLVVLKIF